MLCSSCARLAILNIKKTCVNCKGAVYQNIAVICETCSATSKACAVCLKKIYKNLDNPIYKSIGPGCRSCGRK